VTSRRAFLVGAVTVLAAPVTAEAQQMGQMRRIGVLMGLAESDPQAQARVAAFHKELLTLGWAEGRNIRIDIRWALTSDTPAMQRFAKELVALQPDLILS
jgi:putative ABC transport system substrate-binding protein